MNTLNDYIYNNDDYTINNLFTNMGKSRYKNFMIKYDHYRDIGRMTCYRNYLVDYCDNYDEFNDLDFYVNDHYYNSLYYIALDCNNKYKTLSKICKDHGNYKNRLHEWTIVDNVINMMRRRYNEEK